MRLVLAFSEDFAFDQDDLIIFGHDADFSSALNAVNIQSMKIDEKEISNYFERHVEMSSRHCSAELLGILKGCNNNLFTNHLTLFKWQSAIRYAFENYDIKQVVITDAIHSNSYAPYYEAEGEAHVRLFYKIFDFIPYVLYQFLVDSYPQIDVNIIRWRSRFLRQIRIFIRRDVLLIFKASFFAVKICLSKLKSSKDRDIRCTFRDNSKIVITRSIAHLDGIKKIADSDANNFTFFCGEGIFTFGDNFSYTADRFNRVFSFLSFINLSDVFRCFLSVIRLRKSIVKLDSISYKKVCYSYSSPLVEMIIANFDVELFEIALKRFLAAHGLAKNQISGILYCTEMYTPYALSVAKIGKKVGLMTLQIQTTNMFAMYEPNYIHCDYFIFSTKKLLKSFVEKYPERAHKVLFLGNYQYPLIQRQKNLNNEDRIKKVVYFTQPVTDEDIEQEIISKLCLLSVRLDFELYIKLHPRDNVSKVERFLARCKLIEASKSFDEYMVNIDLAVLKTSSIAANIVLSGVPVLYCLFSDWAKNGALDYIDFDYFGTVTGIDMLESRISNFSQITKSFNIYRKKYIDDCGLDTSLMDFFTSVEHLHCQHEQSSN